AAASDASGANFSRGTAAKASATTGDRNEPDSHSFATRSARRRSGDSDETVSAVTRQTLAPPYDSLGTPYGYGARTKARRRSQAVNASLRNDHGGSLMGVAGAGSAVVRAGAGRDLEGDL
ncbi:MAG: hypothetical protein JWR24_1, partial [Actinoallomurus sp.]|nr:hypothetical protein [Actinoallomurus sp.]